MAQTERKVMNSVGDVVQHEVADVPQDSIELSVNAKGEPSWCVKAYGRDAADVDARLAALVTIATTKASAVRAPKAA